MKRLLLFLLCSSPLLNAMTEVKVKQDSLETVVAQLKEKLLIESVGKNDLATVKALLAEKVNPNSLKCNAFIKAIYRGNINMIQAFIAARVDVNKRDNEYCFTHLMLAIKHKHADIAKLLIATGADIHAKQVEYGGYAVNALRYALVCNQVATAKLLIKLGADLNQIKPIDFDEIPHKLAIIRTIELGKKERQTYLETQKRLEKQKAEMQESKTSEISLTPYSSMYPQLGDDAYHQLAASESAKSKNKAAKKSHCTIL